MKINKNLDSIYQNVVKQKSVLQSEWIKWFDSLACKPLSYYMTAQDVGYLHNLAISPSMNCHVKEKYHLMDQLMLDRGFKLCGGGTNRRAYQSLIDPDVVTKIATDNVGFTSNSRELINQHVIKPFCSKMFDVTRDGTVGLMECVVPIKTIMEYQKYADAIHDMLFFVFRNNDIGMEDIGTRSFKNIGFRNNFGPVVLDYPTMYLLDPNKRYCRAIINGVMCCGTLDYDEGYNSIVCTECGRTYFAKSLARKNGEDINLLMRAVGRSPQRKESNAMRIQIVDENGNTEREIQVSDKSGYVDPSRRRRIVDLNNPAMAQPKPVKTPKFTVFDVEPEKEEAAIPVTTTSVESEPVTIVDSAISDNNDTIRAALLNRHANVTIDELATAYNEALSQFKAVETSTLTPTQVWERVHQAMTKGVTCFKSKVEVIGLWQRLLAATMDIDRPNHFLINDLINMVCPAQSGDGLVDALYMIVNTIKNSIDLFEAIIVYHKTVLELYSFETDETMNETEYKIYRDLYLVYIETIRLLMKDFFTNVAFSGTLTYNAQNIVSIIGRYMSKIVQTADNEMGELDINNYYDITIGNDYCLILQNPRKVEEDNIVVEQTTTVEESDAIEEREEPLEEIASDDSGDDDFDFSGDTLDVIHIDTNNVPTENRMNRKQQNRYGNGNNKGGKHSKKNKHNKR